MSRSNERGVALIMVLLVMMLMSALVVGFTAVVMSDQRFRGIDRDRTQAFYAAHSGLEKMTADLGTIFKLRVAPTAAQLTTIQAAPPVIPGIVYLTAGGSSGYSLTAQAPIAGPVASGSSPWAGLTAIKTIYRMESTARTAVGGEVHLSRRLETVAIPVFQFGMFSDVDLSYFAGPNFGFGGRVHTNGNLFLAQGNGNTLTLSDRVTAFRQIVRQNLSNGVAITTAHNGTVSMRTDTVGAPRNIERTEGSVVGDQASLPNPNWETISKGVAPNYGGWILTGLTGAKQLTLPILTTVVPAVTNIELVRRPSAGEAITSTLLAERFFSKVSLRILLSDLAADISTLPGIDTSRAPVSLETNWNTNTPANYGPIDAAHPPIARSPGALTTHTTGNAHVGNTTVNVDNIPPGLTLPISFWFGTTRITCTGTIMSPSKFTGCVGTPEMPNNSLITMFNNVLSAQNVSLIGGFIKIEMQDNAKVWRDVTMEILNFGIAGPSLADPGGAGVPCGDATPNAIIRLQRLRDNVTDCALYQGSTNAADYWPNTLFDPREGQQRDINPATGDVPLGGVMHYIALDVRNLSNWFRNVAPNAGSGATANNDSGAGFSVYFSDRRNNRNNVSLETGEYGFEDTVNPASGTGAPNLALDDGEDVNGNTVFDTYGQIPNYLGVAGARVSGAAAPLMETARPTDLVSPLIAKVNRPILFRHALKLVRGELADIVKPGLTIVSENPLYVVGNWNATPAGFGDPHAATSFIADAVTLLSTGWNDNMSYSFPYTMTSRNRTAETFVRAAVIAGKGPSFPQPAGTATDFGTDGGAHNFLRYLENGNETVNYRGSLVTLYYSRQATGAFKCCTTVYGAPPRNYAFDTDFLNPALLPPLTPLFRDVNLLGFSQELRPGR